MKQAERKSPYYKVVVIPIHALGLIALWLMVVQFQVWMIFAILIGWFITGCIGTEIGLHRLFSHNSFKINSRPMRWFIGWAACMGGQWSPIFWAALHRGYHHPACDTERDLHSPVNGKWQSYLGWTISLKDSDVRLSFAKDLIADPLHLFLHKHYLKIFWLTIGIFALISFKFALIGVVLPVLLAMHQEFVVNLLCHTRSPLSYRNFETNDNSQNIYPLGLLLWGQGFHNNHHAKPNDYNFGITPREIDICRWIVPALQWIDRKISG